MRRVYKQGLFDIPKSKIALYTICVHYMFATCICNAYLSYTKRARVTKN